LNDRDWAYPGSTLMAVSFERGHTIPEFGMITSDNDHRTMTFPTLINGIGIDRLRCNLPEKIHGSKLPTDTLMPMKMRCPDNFLQVIWKIDHGEK